MLWLRAMFAVLALPAVVALLLPNLIAHFDPWQLAGLQFGLVVLIAGVAILAWCVRDFYVAGKGTLAPWDPPTQLVVVGLYRYTRNPMYVGVLIMLLGWSLLLGSPILLVYALCMGCAFHLRVVHAEETWQKQQFGTVWDDYAKSVPRWLVR
jgi:protein-S-isoprenylcysteine O-methyltransferase Ste14